MNPHDANQPDDNALWRQWRDHFSRASSAVPITDECPSAVDLAAFIDGRWDRATAARMEAHAITCVSCAALAADVKAIEQSIRHTPPFIHPRMIERACGLVADSTDSAPVIRRRLTLAGAIRVGTGWGVAAAAAIAIGLGGYQLGQATGPGSRVSDAEVVTAMSFGLLDDSRNQDEPLIVLASSTGAAQR
jgi:anti-sigma factor RsiW